MSIMKIKPAYCSRFFTVPSRSTCIKEGLRFTFQDMMQYAFLQESIENRLNTLADWAGVTIAEYYQKNEVDNIFRIISNGPRYHVFQDENPIMQKIEVS